jgi:hypothetical protein
MKGIVILACVGLSACAEYPPIPYPYVSYIPEMGQRSTVEWSDGIILLHPTDFVLTSVVNVPPNYALKLRAGPGTRFNVVAVIPADATGIFGVLERRSLGWLYLVVPGRMAEPPWLREWKLSPSLSVGGVGK